MLYEKMKSWGFERKRKQYARAGKVYGAEADKLVRCIFRPVQILKNVIQSNFAYTAMSLSSKFIALSVTYPYQVVRARIQVSSFGPLN